MKKMRLIFVIVLILSFVVTIHSQEKKKDKCGLFNILKKSGDSKKFPGSSYLIVFDKTKVKVMDSGLSHVYNETFYKVLTKKGAQRLKSLVFGYEPSSAYIEIKESMIIKKCGKTIPLSMDSVMDYPAPAWGIYWGAREKILPIGRLEPGDGIWVKSYRKGFTYALLYKEDVLIDDEKYIPPMKGHFYDIVPFYSRQPINKKTYEVFIPANKILQFEFYNGEARHFSKVKGKNNHYLWEKTDILPFKREPNSVSLSDIAPKLLLSTSPDWEAKSLWFHKVNEDYGSFEYDKKIKDKTEEIVKGSKDDWEKISRLTHWVAEEIRYSGISMGKGEGYTLHKGTMTYLDRCGVCKDKAGMLVTMLRAAGFTSYPAMTMAGSRIDRIPADQFNHCVTVIKIKGKYHLLDPTWVPGVRELWSSAEQQQQYLMGVPEGADLKTTPLSPPKKHYLTYIIRSKISSNGDLKADIVIKAEGQSDSRLRGNLSRRMKSWWDIILQRELLKIHPGLKVSNLIFPDPNDISEPIEISFSIQIKDYFIKGKKRAYITPLSSKLPFSHNMFFYRIKTHLKERMHPFRTSCSQWINVKETIMLPKGLKLNNPPKLESVTGSGADFFGFIKQKGNKVIIEKNLSLKKRIYEPEDWKSYRKGVLEFKKPKENVLIFRIGGK